MSDTALPGLRQLIDTVAALRAPDGGCPWDRAQTHETLKPYFVEEVHEFLESLDTQGSSSPESWEELGDVLFQVVLHSQLLSEKGLTHLDEIAGRTAAKLVQRHPHVFDPTAERFETPDEVNKAWERLKAQRKKPGQELSRAQRVASVPKSLPSLQRASRIGEKAASFHFDWPDAHSVVAKIREELQEFEEARDEKHAKEELGDLLFAVAQYARKMHWDPEHLLSEANRKFLDRFALMETLIAQDHKNWDSMNLEELESHWVRAKVASRKKG